ncbi:hypothetical protein ADIMK_3915 [Marinobacterium lacunae]|uniref:Uncharacterized protein n=1 Tax=Marinobacterium lacunae TaxID=1232683 RepID=A0A081FTB3_9GAMM|nr:hypothetical protein ADIMK_3915 [Marinobacterium lacunae]
MWREGLEALAQGGGKATPQQRKPEGRQNRRRGEMKDSA